MIGLFSGASIFSVFIRGLVSGGVLALAGYGFGLLLEHYAPGAWDAGAANAGSTDSSDSGSAGLQMNDFGKSMEGLRSSALDYVVGEDSMGAESPMPIHLPDGTEDVQINSAPPRASRQVHGDGKVVGNVRIIGDRQFPDIPEDYAKAVRTMMSKDDG